MSIPEKDAKLLWGRAAGYCSNPACRIRVTLEGHGDTAYSIGEMAHIIARKKGGPRAPTVAGDDTYDNLILLCANCHTKIDKSAEGTFTEDALREWKRTHEAWVSSLLNSPAFDSTHDLLVYVQSLLCENRFLFDELGPSSKIAEENPVSNAQGIWVARKLDTIIPNNNKIIAALEGHSKFCSVSIMKSFYAFKVHAKSFEASQYDRIDNYPLFPVEFAQAIEEALV
jgi:hypothetical protein